MKLDEIQKIIDEKFRSNKIKKVEKEQKILKMKKNFEESKLAECTFSPEISENSKKMDIILKRKIYIMNKLSTVPRFPETENSKKLNKSFNLNTSHSNNENAIQKQKIRSCNINTTLNMNNSTNNIFAQTTRNSDDNVYRSNHNDNLMESDSVNKLVTSNVIRKNLHNSNILNFSILNETMTKEGNKSISGLPINISKKESDIIKELLKKKYNI